MAQVRTPRESVPSIPARTVYSLAKAAVSWRARAASSASCRAWGRDGDGPTRVFRLRPAALDKVGAVAAVGARELDLDHIVRAVVDRRCPAVARAPGGAGRLLPLPVDLELLGGEALARPGLPAVIAAHWPEQFDVVLVPAGDQQFGVEEAGVDDMHARQEIALLECRMDRGRDRAIVRRPGGRLDVGDQVRAVVVARLGEMHLVPDPLRRTFPRVMGLIVVGRADEDCRGRQIARRAPVDARCIAAVLLDPGAAEGLHRRDRAQPGGGVVGRPGGGGALVRPADVGGAALQADEVCAGLESVPGPLRPGDATALATGLPRVLVLLVAREPRGTAITGWPDEEVAPQPTADEAVGRGKIRPRARKGAGRWRCAARAPGSSRGSCSGATGAAGRRCPRRPRCGACLSISGTATASTCTPRPDPSQQSTDRPVVM